MSKNPSIDELAAYISRLSEDDRKHLELRLAEYQSESGHNNDGSNEKHSQLTPLQKRLLAAPRPKISEASLQAIEKAHQLYNDWDA